MNRLRPLLLVVIINQAFEKEGKQVLPQEDKTLDEIKEQIGHTEGKNLDKERYVER